MASHTKITKAKRKSRRQRAGRRRKNEMARASTPSAVDQFAGFGEPGKPAPAPK